MTLSWWVPVAQARLRRCYWAAEVTECCLSTVRFSDQSQAIDRLLIHQPGVFVPGTVWIVWQGSRLGSADDYSLAVRRWTAGLQGFSHPRWNDLWRSRSRYGLRSTG